MTLWRRLLRRLGLRKPRAAGISVVNMDDAITRLDPDVSQFHTMLTKIASASSEGSSLGGGWRDPRLWGDYEWKTAWEQRRDEAIAHIKRGMAPETVIHWLEDDLVPRVGRVLQTGHPYFRPGDIVRLAR